MFAVVLYVCELCLLLDRRIQREGIASGFRNIKYQHFGNVQPHHHIQPPEQTTGKGDGVVRRIRYHIAVKAQEPQDDIT